MRNIFLTILIALLSLSFLFTDAQAKRFGGGRSFGATRQASSFARPSAPPIMQSAAKPASTASKWLGPLAGFAAGGLLASLFMGHGGGFGGGMLSWILIAVLVFFVWRFISARLQPAPQAMGNNVYPMQQPANTYTQPVDPMGYNNSVSNTSSVRPLGFDESGFLRQAKSSFIRLQAAYDNKNLADLREFTSPEVFAEIQLQLQERGNTPNQTDVINIDAQLLDVAVEFQATLASVMFTGLIREEEGAEPVSIKEIWNFRKDEYKPNWVVAGIQQA